MTTQLRWQIWNNIAHRKEQPERHVINGCPLAGYGQPTSKDIWWPPMCWSLGRYLSLLNLQVAVSDLPWDMQQCHIMMTLCSSWVSHGPQMSSATPLKSCLGTCLVSYKSYEVSMWKGASCLHPFIIILNCDFNHVCSSSCCRIV